MLTADLYTITPQANPLEDYTAYTLNIGNMLCALHDILFNVNS